MRVRSRESVKEENKAKKKKNTIDRLLAGRFKDYIFPSGFVFVIDTREQSPLFNTLPKGLVVVRDTLHNGDYSIRGYEDVFAVERKGMSDFHGYVTVERAKTVEKLTRLASYEFKGLVIEVDEDELHWGNVHVMPRPEVVRQSLVSFQVRYGLHVYISDDRSKIERKVLDWAIKFFLIKSEE
jgi:ERCC4-type nuclease